MLDGGFPRIEDACEIEIRFASTIRSRCRADFKMTVSRWGRSPGSSSASWSAKDTFLIQTAGFTSQARLQRNLPGPNR